MSASRPRSGLRAVRRRLPAPLGLVATAAVLTAAVDTFWMTSMQGAVGSIQRAQSPLRVWLVSTALAVPLYLVAVVGALILARHRLTGRGSPWLRSLAGMALIVGVTSLVGMAGFGVNAAWDYRTQTRQIALDHAHSEGIVQGDDGKIQVGSIVVPGCYGDCAVRSQTRDTHLTALRLASGIVLGTNTVLVLWVVALWGGVSFSRPSGAPARRVARQARSVRRAQPHQKAAAVTT